MVSLTLPVVDRKHPVCGTFSKGGPTAVSVNLCRAGGRYCSRLCRLHPESAHPNPAAGARCYAAACQNRPDRQGLLAKLRRHELENPADLVAQAHAEILHRIKRGNPPRWVRFSTHGSLPNARQATPELLDNIRALLKTCRAHGIGVHIPVETHDKAEFYRKHLGKLATIRESLQDCDTNARGPVSYVAGADLQGRNLRARRLEASKRFAQQRREATGRKVVVCPAVAAHGKGITCDRCGACGKSHIDVVFPAH